MSALNTEGWAGAFDCSVCRRKRLIAAEFSKAQITKHRANDSTPLKCKSCVEAESAKERANAVAAPAPVLAGASEGAPAGSEALHACAACAQDLPESAFTKNAFKKGAGKRRCQKCVEAAEGVTKGEGAAAQEQKMATLKAKVEAAATPAERAAAMSALAAAEAEVVTGLKPVVLGKGGRGGKGGKGKGSGKGEQGGRRSLAALAKGK